MRQIGILLLVSTVLCACVSMDVRKRDDSFEAAMTTYGSAIRWSDFEQAGKFRDPAVTGSSRLPSSDHIKVTGYETLSSSRTEDGNEAAIKVRISYYHKDTMTEKTVVDQQVWKYHADEQHWYITTALPEFR